MRRAEKGVKTEVKSVVKTTLKTPEDQVKSGELKTPIPPRVSPSLEVGVSPYWGRYGSARVYFRLAPSHGPRPAGKPARVWCYNVTPSDRPHIRPSPNLYSRDNRSLAPEITFVPALYGLRRCGEAGGSPPRRPGPAVLARPLPPQRRRQDHPILRGLTDQVSAVSLSAIRSALCSGHGQSYVLSPDCRPPGAQSGLPSYPAVGATP